MVAVVLVLVMVVVVVVVVVTAFVRVAVVIIVGATIVNVVKNGGGVQRWKTYKHTSNACVNFCRTQEGLA